MEEMKVIKEQTDDFGEITVVVIDGECNFLFSEINKVMQIGRRSRFMREGYTEETFDNVQEMKGWRIEALPSIGEQLLVNFSGVKECFQQSRRSLYVWADDEAISREKEDEMEKELFNFFCRLGYLFLKYSDWVARGKANEPLRKAMSAITGEEI